MLVVEDPKANMLVLSPSRDYTIFEAYGRNVLLSVESQEWQVKDDSQPVAIDDEEEGQKGVNGGFRDNVGVQAVAEVDGVDVVTVVTIAVSNYSSHC